MRVISTALKFGLLLCALTVWAPGVAMAYDGLNDATLGDTPYRSATLFDQATPVFPTGGFTESPQELSNSPGRLGCANAWGAKTAWVRFATAAQGRVFVDVDSSHATSHDVFYKVYTAPTSIPPGTAADNQLTDRDCFNGSPAGAPDESYVFGYAIPANQTIYVQVASICETGPPAPGPTSPCDANELENAPAGSVSIRVRFAPDNADNDAVPDSLDPCPTTPGSSNGCPDTDGDGVGDPFDACPTIRGRAADGCRLPDEDGDSYAANAADSRFRDCNDDSAAVNPAAKEVRGNQIDENCDGLAAFDRDRDNHDDRPGPDCDPGNPKIHPGARDIPGNRVDEDCDQKFTPFPRVVNEVAPSYLLLRGRTVGFASFKVLSVRKGMQIRIECRGARCPYPAKTFKVRKAGSELTVGKEFRRRLLPAGAQVTIKIMRRGYVGRALRFTLRKGKGKPKIGKYCLNAGTTRPLRKKC